MSKRSAAILFSLGLLTVTGLFVGWNLWQQAKHSEDLSAALEVNARGVGHMEQYEYEKAEALFRQVTQMAPNWMPGYINLGIALLNQDKEPQLNEAIDLFRKVLAREPENPHAHFCLGFILAYYRNYTEAIPHFRKVVEKDPSDAGAWYQLGYVLSQQGDDTDEATRCFERAHRLNPYMSGPLSNLISRVDDEERKQRLVQEDAELRAAQVMAPNTLKYTEQSSRYARVIPGTQAPAAPLAPLSFSPLSTFKVSLAPGTRWASPADLGSGDLGTLRREIRRRFGATMIAFDYNRDNRLDLFLVNAVVRDGRLGDLLLRNDGDGSFTDVTEAAGLDGERPGLAVVAVDFTNDGWPDLLITGAGQTRLFRNDSQGRFEDVTVAAGLDSIDDVILGATWLDLDQDGDLDLILCRFAKTIPEALEALEGRAPQGGGFAIFINTGVAEPVPAGAFYGGLTVQFRRLPDLEKSLTSPNRPISTIISDVDGDLDVDLLVSSQRGTVQLLENRRLLRLQSHSLKLPSEFPDLPSLIPIDVDQDERTDVLVVGEREPTRLLMNRSLPGDDLSQAFEAGPSFPSMRQARVADVDLDGWPDVVGISAENQLILLRNQRQDGLREEASSLAAIDANPTPAQACLLLDLNRDLFPDLIVWREQGGLEAWSNNGVEGHRGVVLRLLGRRENASPPGERVNSDAIGTRVTVQVGRHATTTEAVPSVGGLGQAVTPITFGIGPAKPADAIVRVTWPDMVVQAEFLNDPRGQNCSLDAENVWELREKNRKPTSCPVVLTWDGNKWVYITDFLGEGSIGEMRAGGGTRPARPEESLKIESHQLGLKDGAYVMRIAEPMDEIALLDRLRLDVIDLPPGLDVLPDERFATSDPPPTQRPLFFRQRIPLSNARDETGRDVTDLILKHDGRRRGGFGLRSWIGFAADHWIEFDFATDPSTFPSGQRCVLVLRGWTDYAFPESIFAAEQAGVALQSPILEGLTSDGHWQKVVDLGFPAGLPRTITCDVTGKLSAEFRRWRIRTNMHIYWDQIFLALSEDQHPSRIHELTVTQAELGYYGILKELRPGGGPLVEYDPVRTEDTSMTRWRGLLTRYGDVTELLAETDDRVAIIGPGDEITVRFDARNLPDVPEGWTRAFILRTWGWCKDSSPFTATGGAVHPLPFRGMSQYPPPRGERYPHPDDLRKWHTRPMR